MMYHYTYITEAQNGNYYVGRHSTKNLDDKYQGSGLWVLQCKKQKKPLNTKILQFYSTEEDLKRAEEKLISENIDNENCMNRNINSCGFSTGSMNPANIKGFIAKRPQNNKGAKTSKFCYDNPSKNDWHKELNSKKAEELLLQGTHNFQNPEVRSKVIIAAQKRFIENNPMFKENNKVNASRSAKHQIANNAHNFQKEENRKKSAKKLSEIMSGDKNPMKNFEISKLFKGPKPKVTCPHCNRQGGKPVMMRYHFDFCKSKS